jgi:hypothetical protein
MRIIIVTFALILIAATTASGWGDIAIGPRFGYGFPVANKWADPGPSFGIQVRTSLVPLLEAGVYFNTRSYGDLELVYFESEPFAFSGNLDGGNITEYGLNLYLGRTGYIGLNYFAIGGLGSHKWKRDHRKEDSKLAYRVGLGFEYVLPKNLGIEAQTVFETVSAGHKSVWKSVVACIGVNYHFNFGFN